MRGGLDVFAKGLAALCCAYPATLYCAENMRLIEQQDISHLLGLGLITGVLLIAGFVLIGQRSSWVSEAILAVILFLFSYRVAEMISSVLLAKSEIFLSQNRVQFCIGAMLIGVFILCRWRSRPLFFRVFLGFFAFTATLFAAAMNRPTISGSQLAKIGSSQPKASAPNIYWIILDAHPSQAGLEPKFGTAETRASLDALQSKGFLALEKGKSNYIQTRQSIAAILNLDYLQLDNGNFNAASLYPRIRLEGEEPTLIRRLHETGYETRFAESTTFRCVYGDRLCVPASEPLTWRYMIFSILENTPLANFKRLFQREFRIDALANARQPSLGDGLRKPLFMMFHELSPHPPYRFDDQCRTGVKTPSLFDSWNSAAIPAFANETRCLWRDIGKTVDVIITRDKDAIIIIQGDHGPGFALRDLRGKSMHEWSVQGVLERLSFLNRVRLPARCGSMAREDIGQINTARLVLACATANPLRYVSERSILSSYYENGIRELRAPNVLP